MHLIDNRTIQQPASIRRHSRKSAGFTLVELLVVLGIIAVLTAMSASAIVTVRRHANMVVCAAQLSNIAKALIAYGNDQGAFPPNTAMASIWWTDEAILGPYAGYTYTPSIGAYAKGMVCPEDDGSVRSYAMNMWASSFVDWMEAFAPTYGEFWKPTSGPASQLMLVVESYPIYSDGPGWNYGPYFVGADTHTSAQRFGALGGIDPLFTHTGHYINSELEWRHRTSRQPRINLAFADGHVQSFTQADLAHVDGTLTGEAWWTPADFQR